MENKEIIKKVLDYIEDNLDGKLDLDKIAQEAGYSKFHLTRVFSEEVGCTIYKYIQMRRLHVAANELTDTEKPIAEIAFEAGYGSQQAFTYAFRQIYGYPPQAYRAIKLHISKPNKFEPESKLVNKLIMESEVIAA